MELVCPTCSQRLQFSGKRPTFCAYCGKPLPSPAEDPTVAPDTATAEPAGGDGEDPAEIGGYRLLQKLGEGGMGRVYEAEEIASGRRVALKLIAARYVESPDAVERFRREGRLASSVAHPRCVFIFAADEAQGRPYIVMELMPGTTLQDLVQKDGPLSVEDGVARILEIMDGLRELHRLGIVHRDVKPSNCLVDAQGQAKIADFGLSRSLVRADALTRTGSFIGTPLFAAPEQIKGESVGPTADAYSVAATLYYLLTGRAPFQGGDHAATLARIVSDPAPPMGSVRAELPAALDRVVLHGLERDPAKRWRNLDEFETALLPFLPGRLSIGGLGIRCGAFFIDYACIFILALPFTFMVLAEAFEQPGGQINLSIEQQGPPMLVGIILWLVYFGACEAVWGCTPGKRFLGLRVSTGYPGERPRLMAAALRAGLFYLLLNLGTIGFWGLMFAYPMDPAVADPGRQMLMGLLVNLIFYPLEALGVGLLCSTMRARNGYRGLHEVLSGTCVVRLPETSWRPLTRPDQELATSWPSGLPAQVGPYKVAGLLTESGPEQVLLAHDPSLDRRVWIWRRPADAAPLSPVRHTINRPTRLRWLASGADGAHQWDAFLAPTGSALAVGAPNVQGSWRDVRVMLRDLANELMAADADGTLPSVLSIDQVWVRSDGHVTLLDTAVEPTESDAKESPLELIAHTASVALGVHPRMRHGEPIAVGIPLPRHADAIVGRLIGIGEPFASVRQFQEALAASRDRPPETTRMRRLAHLALQATFLSLTFCCGVGPAAILPAMFAVSGWARIDQLERIGARLAEVADGDKKAAQDPDPARRQAALQKGEENARLAALLEDALVRARAERLERLDSLGWVNRNYAQLVEKQVADMITKQGTTMRFVPPASEPDHFRSFARIVITQKDDFAGELFGMAVAQTVLLALWPTLWIMWAFITRGGLTLLIVSLALARRDGRPALRVQCAWRALLIWLPVVLLAVAVVWLDVLYWAAGAGAGGGWILSASTALWWTAMALLLLYVALALWRPARSLHDWLAGTYMVPR
jgi:eukaryotic-like serine/threonine-protein kinase